MSLNDISFSPFLLSAFYSKSLVGDENKDGEPTERSITQMPLSLEPTENKGEMFKFLGNNQKKVTIVVNYSGIVHLPDAQLDFLARLLTPCKMSLNDVAVLNINNYQDIRHQEVLDYLKPAVVMLFGMSTQQFGFPFDIPEYQVQSFASRLIMHAPALEQLENDTTEKLKLWTGLKKIFNV